MEIYIVNVFAILIIGAFFGEKNRNKNKNTKGIHDNNKLCWIYFFILFSISILRDESVGADVLVYKNHFQHISTLPFLTLDYQGWEVGYILLNSIIGMFTNNFRVLMIAVAAIILGGYSIFIYRNSFNITLSFFLLITLDFFTHSLNIYRQSLAIIFVLIAFSHIKKRSLKKYILWIIIASLFHKTALICLPFYFICRIKFNVKYVFTVIASLPLIILLGNKIIDLLINVKYTTYKDIIIRGEGYKLALLYIGLFFFVLYFKGNLEKYNTCLEKRYQLECDINILYHGVFISVIFQILTLYFSLFSRVNLYYSIFWIILIPDIIQSLKRPQERFLIKILFLSLFLIFYIISCYQDRANIVPYILNT